MDKSRPSREHNLVEWARPLLNHNKKLLRILDPRMEGQYSAKTAMKVAHLAYQCLSQNPKGRPLMNQVVEIVETFQTKEENQEEAMFQSGGSGITLYEAPKPVFVEKRNLNTDNDEMAGNKKDLYKKDGEGVAEVYRRSKPGNGRSNSEPPNDFFERHGQSLDDGSDEKSASTRR